MPSLPPTLVQSDVTVTYPRVVSYNGYGSASEYKQQDGESNVDYALRLTRTYLPTVSELVKGKSAVEKVAILESRIKSIESQGLLDWPIIGPMYFQPRYDEYLISLPALRAEAKADVEAKYYRNVAYASAAVAGILFVGYQAVRLLDRLDQKKAPKKGGT